MMKLFEKQKLKNLTNENEVHHFVESLKLTFADREMYFTGQKKPQVTAHHLLNNQYLNKRLKLISPKAIESIIPGDPVKNKILLPIDNEIKPW